MPTHDAVNEQLVTDARSGDLHAIEKLAAELLARMTRYIHRRMQARDHRWIEADDLAQIVVHEQIRKLDQLPVEAGFETLLQWAQRTAGSRIHDQYRKARYFAGPSGVDSLTSTPTAPTPTTGPVTHRDEIEWLETELLTRLPEKYSDVVRLCGIEGLSYRDAAKRLNEKPDTIRKRYERAMDRLQVRVNIRRKAK